MGNTLDGVNTEVEDVPTVDDVGSSSASGPGAAGDEVGLSGPWRCESSLPRRSLHWAIWCDRAAPRASH